MLTPSSKPTNALIVIARAAFLSGEIAQIPNRNRDNASYTIEVPGYRVACKINVTNITEEAFSGDDDESSIVPFYTHWNGFRTSERSDPMFVMRYFKKVEVTTRMNASSDLEEYMNRILVIPNPFSQWNPNTTYNGQYYITTCRPMPTLYVVDVSYEGSKQQIEYTTSDHQGPKPNYTAITTLTQSELNSFRGLSSNETMQFSPEFEQILQLWEQWGMLDAALGTLDYICKFGGSSGSHSEDYSVTTSEVSGCSSICKSIFFQLCRFSRLTPLHIIPGESH